MRFRLTPPVAPTARIEIITVSIGYRGSNDTTHQANTRFAPEKNAGPYANAVTRRHFAVRLA